MTSQNIESTVHYGTYGTGLPRERQADLIYRRAKPLTCKEITERFVTWGIIGKRRQINPVLRLMPYFDRGPGIGGIDDGS